MDNNLSTLYIKKLENVLKDLKNHVNSLLNLRSNLVKPIRVENYLSDRGIRRPKSISPSMTSHEASIKLQQKFENDLIELIRVS